MKGVRVSIAAKKGECSRTKIGDYFIIRNGKIHAPFKQGFCHYALLALMPVLTPGQREGETGHKRLGEIKEICCPKGQVVYKIEVEEALTSR